MLYKSEKYKFLIIIALFIVSTLTFAPSSAHAFEQDTWLSDFSDVRKTHRKKVSYTKYDDDDFDFPSYSKRPKGKNTIKAEVDLSSQRMKVYINDRFWQEWKVSSGAGKHRTPTGKWRPTRIHKQWYSRTYHNSPMPHSVFFHYGYAVHGTQYIRSLGRPASHGCIRLHPKHAEAFYDKVKEFGMHKAKIVITK